MAAPSPILILPFVLLLGAMALAPVLAPQWWLKHYPKVALGLGAVTAAAYLFILRDAASLEAVAHEYVSFIALIGSLYVIAGGIRIQTPDEATPRLNVIFLLVGAGAANLLGTTGAAMLLIRPWIHMNRGRVKAYHIVFFIFAVANVGGCLTPIGDPPLFLGFLQGIPFWWVAEKCWPMWVVSTGLLLAIFYVLDWTAWSRTKMSPLEPGTNDGEGRAHPSPLIPPPVEGSGKRKAAWAVEGLPNLFFLALVLGALFISRPLFLRELLMLAAAAGSYFTTRKSVHAANEFNFHPVTEVAVLFAGIFVTMVPALAWLDHGASRLLGENPGPAVFFWGTGSLSAVLDNAPTFLGFLNALFGIAGTREITLLLDQRTVHVLAVCVGAVFFGAATYIGNGPNFMVKSIAAHHGVPMPSFLEFVWKYSLPFLLPVLIVNWLLFFRD